MEKTASPSLTTAAVGTARMPLTPSTFTSALAGFSQQVAITRTIAVTPIIRIMLLSYFTQWH